MIEVIPAIIPHDLNTIREKLIKVLGVVKKIQIDIIDGKYAHTKTWPFNGNQFEEMIKMVREEEKFPFVDNFNMEIDLMTLDPFDYISDFISLGAKSFVIHLGSTDNPEECIRSIKNTELEIGLGINPSSKEKDYENLISKVDFVQFMGNDKIGFSGIDLDKSVITKIKDFKKKYPLTPTQIDIGVNENTAKELIQAGVSRLVSGSFIFDSIDPKEAISKIKNQTL